MAAPASNLLNSSGLMVTQASGGSSKNASTSPSFLSFNFKAKVGFSSSHSSKTELISIHGIMIMQRRTELVLLTCCVGCVFIHVFPNT